MNRLISILITLFVIFLVYIWINNVMSKGPDDQVSNTDAVTEEVIANEQEESGIAKADQSDNENGDLEQQAETKNESAQADKTQDTPPIAIPVNHKPPTPEPKVTKTSAQSQKQSTEPKKVRNAAQLHMVIAGNFSKRSNAENRLKELQRNGYKNAEIVNFDLSEYYTVCAGRFDELLEAKRIAKKVRDFLNIEAYVRVGKQ